LDQHNAELQQWAAEHFTRVFQQPTLDSHSLLSSWSQVAGDASLRRYYRLSSSDRSVIVMDSSKELNAAVEFGRVAQMLAQGGVRVPRIYSADFNKGYLLLEDFGDQLLKTQLTPEHGDQLFEKILPLLLEISLCDASDLPEYTPQLLADELDYFDEWYLQRHRKYFLSKSERKLWEQLKDMLVGSAVSQPQVPVHRDFHSCNLHQLPENEIGVIDFQDAVRGPLTYDLASWIWDRYIYWPRETIVAWIEKARESMVPVIGSSITAAEWLRYCDFMGLQRNIKIVGVFARLHYRDGKSGYLEMIPQFGAYINDVLQRYSEFEFAVDVMNNWLE